MRAIMLEHILNFRCRQSLNVSNSDILDGQVLAEKFDIVDVASHISFCLVPLQLLMNSIFSCKFFLHI